MDFSVSLRNVYHHSSINQISFLLKGIFNLRNRNANEIKTIFLTLVIQIIFFSSAQNLLLNMVNKSSVNFTIGVCTSVYNFTFV